MIRGTENAGNSLDPFKKELAWAVANCPVEKLAELLGMLKRCEVEAQARLMIYLATRGAGRSGENQEDRLLKVGEASQRLGTSQDYLYRHSKSFPFTVRMGRRLFFSSHGISQYIRRQQRGE